MKSFLFDFDGVIADSEPLHLETFRETVAPLGIEIAEKRWYVEFTGKGSPYIMKVLLGEKGITDEKIVKKYVDERRELFRKRIAEGKLKEKKGIHSFLEKAKKAGIRLAIVSAGHKSNILFALSKLGLEQYFDLIIGREDYKNNKPDPEPYLAASEKLGIPPEKCVAFEDSISGCQSAQAAGMRVVLIDSPAPPGPGSCKPFLKIKDFEGLEPKRIQV